MPPAIPDSSLESENILNVNKILLNNLMVTKSSVIDIAKHSSCCIAVKKITNTELHSTVKELEKLPAVSISMATEAIRVGHGIGESLRGHGKVQQTSHGLHVPLLQCQVTGIAIYGGNLQVYYFNVQSSDNLTETLSNCICTGSLFRKKIIAFDIKRYAKFLSNGFNIDLSEAALLDPSVAHWLTNPDGKQLS